MRDQREGRAIGVRAASVVVRDFDRSIEFYTKILGLEVVLEERRYNWVELGPDREMGRLALAEYQGEGPEPGGRTGIILVVKDLNSLYRRAKSEGVVFLSPPGRRPWRGIVAELEDPDGNVITLMDEEMISPWLMGA
jgi:catechol 2,3-dioxygenase-like lactoylglutathione lyase family enzyme